MGWGTLGIILLSMGVSVVSLSDSVIFLPKNRLKRAAKIFLPFLLGALLVIVSPTIMPSLAISVSDVPNPRQANGGWVMDMAEMLSPSSEASLNAMITQLEATNGTEIAVVTVPDTQPANSPKAFATDLFNQWGIGKKGIDNGVLFLVSKGDRRTEVETGYAIEAILPDARVGDILRSQVTPLFKVGDFDAGIVSGLETIIGLLQTESFAPPTTLELAGRYSRWILNGVLVSVAAGVATFALKGGKKEIRLKPVGQSKAPAIRRRGKLLLIVINWLSGDGSFWGKEYRPQTASLVHSPNQSILKAWWKVFWLGMIFWVIILRATLGSAIWILWLVTLLWLGYEIYQSAQPNSDQSPRQHTVGKLGLVGVLSLCSSLFGISAIGIEFYLLTLASLYGAFAGALKFKRSLAAEPNILCKKCDLPMEKLEEDILRAQLSPVENTTWTIRSCLYEGWRCPSCHLEQAKNGLDLHLFSQVVLPQKFEYCKDCKGLTQSTESKVVNAATTSSQGTRLITTYCACCEKETQETRVIPRKSSSSYSSSSSSYYSGTSSSYGSSDSGSSSDFGGGSSGGGGAGDSW